MATPILGLERGASEAEIADRLDVVREMVLGTAARALADIGIALAEELAIARAALRAEADAAVAESGIVMPSGDVVVDEIGEVRRLRSAGAGFKAAEARIREVAVRRRDEIRATADDEFAAAKAEAEHLLAHVPAHTGVRAGAAV